MFGYVKVYKPELKMKEFEMYKGIYCSLCKQLGKSYGIFSRFILNYDITFLAMLLLAANENESKFQKSHCTFCFAKKCVCCELPDESLEFAAAMTILMGHHKILDNIEDGNSFKKFLCLLALPYLKSKYKKASKIYPDASAIIEEETAKQKITEASGTSSIDRAADASATALGKIVALKFPENEKEKAYRFGYCLGRFVYICDALDDLEKDNKECNYNAFLMGNHPDYDIIRKNAYSILDITADALAIAYESLNIHRYKSILDNIIYYGLDCVINKVLKKEENTDEKSL